MACPFGQVAGKSARIEVGWSKVTLLDLPEQALGRAWEAQAKQWQIANAALMWQMGLWEQERVLRGLDPDATGIATPMAAPPAVPNDGGPRLLPSEGYGG